MSVAFLQLQPQIREMGALVQARLKELEDQRQKARRLLHEHARRSTALRQKVARLVHSDDPSLRCALPADEPLDLSLPTPPVPPSATLIAADGSQINPDRHAEVDFCLVNVGAIQMQLDSPAPPTTSTTSRLLYDEKLDTRTGGMTDAMLALLRDLNERQALVDLASQATTRPVITFTDGPLELWGAKDPEIAPDFRKHLQAYLRVLARLRDLGVTTAGYVDKPGASLVVRLLEVAITPEDEFSDFRNHHPLRGASDLHLFSQLLDPGHRSAVYAMQSQSAANYRDELGLHFFYLNVGRPGQPDLARVEIPAWVAEDRSRLETLHAVLVAQCQVLGPRAYPYLLHRAHEVAVVTQAEKDQLTRMILQELRRRGVPVGRKSSKQAVKDLSKGASRAR